MELKKIVVLGPESTGKSFLCSLLAKHYQTSWCPEFARQYLEQHGMHYSFDDLLKIAQGQLNLETEYARNIIANNQNVHGNRLLFIDTDMYVMKVWCEFVFDKCHSFILDQIVHRSYDLYFLCKPDLPWVKDELREYPNMETRSRIYCMYKDLLVQQSIPWVEIHGNYDERLQTAVKTVDNFFL